jgi:hypothetical protein
MLGIDHGHDGIERSLAAEVFVNEKGLRDRRRIGKSRGFDQDPVEATLAPHQPGEDADEIAADGAADATVLENLFIRVDDEVIVDADLAEFVDNDRVALAVGLGERMRLSNVVLPEPR